MNACDLLTKDIGCSRNRHDVGLKGKGYIFNRGDFESLENFILKANKRGFIFNQDGRQPFNGTNSALLVGAKRSYYTHKVNAVIFDKEVVEMLRKGDFVVVVDRGATKEKEGNTSFEAFGLTNGMKLTEANQNFYSEDSDAGWSVVLTEERANISKSIFSDQPYKIAKAMLELMCKEATEPTPSDWEGYVVDEVLTITKGAKVVGEVLML